MDTKLKILYIFLIVVASIGLSCSKDVKPTRFLVNDNGYIIDKGTNLMWASMDNGEDVSWEDAATYCEKYEGGGFIDWRLPFLRELKTVFVNKYSRKSNFGELIRVESKTLWSANINHTVMYAGYFNIDDGFGSYGPIYGNIKARALPVRDLKN